jgi:ABC-type branched-subunit amino acid transport system substrate-binding protein
MRTNLIAMMLASAMFCGSAEAQKKYDVGASDTEVRIGQTVPYSGPVSGLSMFGRVVVGYFEMLNEKGGINGRKIKMISADDAYSPPKTVEQTRRLVEQDEVLAVMASLGTPTNIAVRKYLNAKQVPQLLVLSSSAQWNNPREYPYSTSMNIAADQEAIAMGKFVAGKHPGAKIGILYQNDDFGKDYIRALKDGLGEGGRRAIVQELSYEVSSPTIDSQIVTLKTSGADVVVAAATPKFGALAFRKMFEMQWKPHRYVAAGAIGNLKSALDPEMTKGLISIAFYRDPNDPKLEGEDDGKEYFEFMKKYAPNDNPRDMAAVYAYVTAQASAEIIKRCGDDLTRENLLRVATNLKDVRVKLLFDGVSLNTSPSDYLPIKKARMIEFDGTSWKAFGDPIDAPTPSP